jgi:hypothetical protein
MESCRGIDKETNIGEKVCESKSAISVQGLKRWRERCRESNGERQRSPATYLQRKHLPPLLGRARRTPVLLVRARLLSGRSRGGREVEGGCSWVECMRSRMGRQEVGVDLDRLAL